MMGHGRRTAFGFTLFAVLLLLDLGCTGSNELVSESGNLSLEVAVNPPNAGRYEQALIKLIQVTVRPADPVANTSLGSTPFGMLSTPLQLTLLNPSSVLAAGISLGDGQYQLETVTLEDPVLTDLDPVNPPTTCLEGVLVRSAGRLPPPEIVLTPQNSKITLGPFSPPVFFSVPRSANRTVRMVINGPALVALFEAAFTCRTTGSCGAGAPAPCMSNFTQITPDAAEAVISFE